MPNKNQIEQEIQAKGLNAPILILDLIDSVIVGETYTNLPDGRTVICHLTLKNGITVDGKSVCVRKNNFNQEIGNKISRQNARDKIWELGNYLFKEKLNQVNNQVEVILEARIPILEQIYDLCQAIDKCGSSPEITNAAVKAGGLREPINKLIIQTVAIGFTNGSLGATLNT